MKNTESDSAVLNNAQTDPEELVKSIDSVKAERVNKMVNKTVISVYALLILLGTATGYALSQRITLNRDSHSSQKGDTMVTENVIGSTDEETFSDSAVGELEKGGLDGLGTHKLIREGGPSQTAYLISSVIDLDEFIGKKIKVWGQSQKTNASWLMDVGKIELLNE